MEDLVFISYSTADKPVADAICHKLEEQDIRCWIAPRDITTTDWAGSIMDGLRRSRVFVVVISHNSILSPEVTKEVTEATRTCQYLLPFKLDTDALSNRLRYHLGPCHWLDAVDPPLEKRIDELVQRIEHLSEEDAVYMNRDRMRLSDRMLYPRGLFVGRETEVTEIAQRLSEEHVLFLQGMGGLGKSEIAKGYAKAARERYENVIFADYATDLRDLVCELPIENLNRADGETQELWFRRKLEAFHLLSSERTLLIVDNFDVDEDPDLENLIACPAHFLFTTRNDHSDYSTLHVGPIRDFASVQKIFSSHYGRPVKAEEQSVVDQMRRVVGCRRITVELIAKQMKASFLKPEQMLERLRSTGVNTRLKEKVKREGVEEKRTSFDYIRQLFTLSGLSEAERHLLEVLCLVPRSGIPAPQLGQILELEDFDAVNSLVGKSWLSLDEDTDLLQLHPVICDVVKEELKPTLLSCQDYIRGLWLNMKMCWFFTKEERLQSYPLVLQILLDFPDPVPELWEELSGFTNIGWQCWDYQRSQFYTERYYQKALGFFGVADRRTARAAFYVASSYHNAGDDVSAEPWYRRAAESHEAAEDFGGELAQAYVRVGRCAKSRGDLEEAQRYYDKAAALYQELEERKIYPPGWSTPNGYLDFLDDLSRLELIKGNYELSIQYAQRCYDGLMQKFGEESTNSAYALLDLGECYSRLGEYDQAEDYLRRALEINLTHNGKDNLQTLQCREALGDNALRQGDREQARTIYAELYMDTEKSFGAENPQSLRIRAKWEELEA
jgi:tetratricopeptide (TPR) repeat protein